ncbi:hypothetical protein ACTXT7_006772 [Hymenolepis weldensis]
MSANTSKLNGSLAEFMMQDSTAVQQRLSTGTSSHLPAASSATFLYGHIGTNSSAPAPPVRSSSTLKKERPMISPPSKPLPTPPVKKEKKRKVKLFRLPLFNRSGSAEPSISCPMDVKHDLHVVFDQKSGDFLRQFCLHSHSIRLKRELKYRINCSKMTLLRRYLLNTYFPFSRLSALPIIHFIALLQCAKPLPRLCCGTVYRASDQ